MPHHFREDHIFFTQKWKITGTLCPINILVKNSHAMSLLSILWTTRMEINLFYTPCINWLTKFQICYNIVKYVIFSMKIWQVRWLITNSEQIKIVKWYSVLQYFWFNVILFIVHASTCMAKLNELYSQHEPCILNAKSRTTVCVIQLGKSIAELLVSGKKKTIIYT